MTSETNSTGDMPPSDNTVEVSCECHGSNFEEIWKKIGIDPKTIQIEIERLMIQNCWGCSSIDTLVSECQSAHQFGCRQCKNEAIHWFAKDALVNVYFRKMFDLSNEIEAQFRKKVAECWEQ